MTNVLLLKDGKYVKIDSVSLANLPQNERIWIQLTNPNEIEVKRVIDELHIPEDFVRSAFFTNFCWSFIVCTNFICA